MMSTIGLLFGLAAGVQPGLVLELSAPKRDVFVGEPVKVVVRLKATKDVVGVPWDGERVPVQFLRFIVDSGASTSTYVEYPRQIEERVLVADQLRPGDERLMNFVLFNGRHVGTAPQPTTSFLFPAAGHFSLSVAYAGEQQSPVTSNPVRFEVHAAPADSAEILDAVRREPRILDGNGNAAAQQKARELVDRFPQSPYLRWAKLCLLEERANAPDRGLDADTVGRLRRSDTQTLERHRVAEYERLTEELLANGTDWGPFEEEALALGVLTAQGAGNAKKAAELRATIYARYPRSATAKRLRLEDQSSADDEDDDNEVLIRPTAKPTPKPQ